jgi:hypothetical protein
MQEMSAGDTSNARASSDEDRARSQNWTLSRKAAAGASSSDALPLLMIAPVHPVGGRQGLHGFAELPGESVAPSLLEMRSLTTLRLYFYALVKRPSRIFRPPRDFKRSGQRAEPLNAAMKTWQTEPSPPRSRSSLQKGSC